MELSPPHTMLYRGLSPSHGEHYIQSYLPLTICYIEDYLPHKNTTYRVISPHNMLYRGLFPS
jgi:hypothetical protein